MHTRGQHETERAGELLEQCLLEAQLVFRVLA